MTLQNSILSQFRRVKIWSKDFGFVTLPPKILEEILFLASSSFWWWEVSLGLWLHHCNLYICLPMVLQLWVSNIFLPFSHKDLGTTKVIQDDLTSRSLTELHLQRSFFQMRSHAQFLGRNIFWEVTTIFIIKIVTVFIWIIFLRFWFQKYACFKKHELFFLSLFGTV